MTRRELLQSGFGAAGLALAANAGAEETMSAGDKTVDAAARTVLEPARHTPVAADVDVLVIGGGPAGIGAALAAAGEGARTLLIERHVMLGGVWTAGLLNPFFDATGKGWLVADLISRLQAAGAWRNWLWGVGTFDTEAMKFLLEQMMDEAGVQFWYYSFMADAIVENGVVRGVIIESKSGREAVLAKVTIDCSGDGDVAARAGVPFTLGRSEDNLCQPMTLMFEVDGVAAFVQNTPYDLYDPTVEAIEKHGLDVKLPWGRVNNAPWIVHVPREGAADVQATHVYEVNPLDVRALTRATVEARRQAHDLVRVWRHIPDLESMRITQTAPAIGIREARHIHGRYTLTLDDLVAGRDFDDAVTFGAFGVDIHNVKQEVTDAQNGRQTRPYGIPYRCLLPEGREGLLVAGRCISGTHEAHASYRVTGTCMAMGQAAGLAAAMAVADGCTPGALDGTAIRAALCAKGVGMRPALT